GTEAGLSGGPEPACREAFPWDAPWSVDLRPFIQELAGLRKRHPSLRKSGLCWSPEGADGLRGEASNLLLLVNRSRSEWLKPSSGMSGSLEWQSGSVSPEGLVGPQSAALLLL
ncbi:MAG: alpha-amylase, partial [Synechococcus sp. CPC35]|nr:alpha-amylase [Synechococcus sp. CPC35]